MRERISSIGGKIRIRSAPKQGTTIEASVPLAKSN
jgi:signal transduction histidine kinase